MSTRVRNPKSSPKVKRKAKHNGNSVVQFAKDNALSIVTVGLFLIFWAAQSVAGFFVFNQEAVDHAQPTATYLQYLGSAHFWEATTENWESEFLQMTSMVVLTIFLKQKGSAESNSEEDFAKDEPAAISGNKVLKWLSENSLALALAGLFAASIAAHTATSLAEFNADQLEHGKPPVQLAKFIQEPQLWFESMQNWQSEYLAVATLTILSIYLRQKGSAESKDLHAPNRQTGS